MWSRLPLERMQRIFGSDATREQVAQMNARERDKRIREYSYRVTNIANKRIGRLEEEGVNSPAYRHWMDDNGGVRFGIRGMDSDSVITEIQRAEKFNQMSTSTVTGATRYLKDLGDRLGMEVSDRLSIQEQSSRVFAVVSKLEQLMGTDGGNAEGSEALQQYVSEYMQVNNVSGMDTEDLVAMIYAGGDIRRNIREGVFGAVEREIQENEGLGDFGHMLL